MKKIDQENVLAFAILTFDHQEARIEKLAPGENAPGAIRLSGCNIDQPSAGPLVLFEEELIELVHQAIHAGVLSPDFVRKLREWIEI